MMKVETRAVWVAVAMAVIVTTGLVNAGFTTIYSEAFDGTGELHGKTTTVGGGTWAATNVYGADGVMAGGNASATLEFTPEAGFVYTLSASYENVPTSGTIWIGLGFAQEEENFGDFFPGDPHGRARFTTADVIPGYAWMIAHPDNGVQVFEGPTTTNGTPWDDSFDVGDAYTLTVVLDTTGADWTSTMFFNGAEVHGYTHDGSLPIDRLGVTKNAAGSTGTLTEFSLTAIPEPTTMVLLGLGGLAVLKRKR